MTHDAPSAAADTTPEQPLSPPIAAALVENHRAFLAFLQGKVGDRALAEDLLQDAFVKSADKVAALRQSEALIPWFYRVLRNAMIDYQRRGATAQRALLQFAGELEDERPDNEVHAVICRCVSQLAQTLKPEYAQALQRVDVDGLPVKDYADEQAITSSNAGVRVFRAREALRRRVLQSCGTCATHGCLDCTCGGR